MVLDHTVDSTLELPGPSCDRPPAIDPEDNQWEVERLVSKRQIGRVVWYMVKWRGYPASENTWEKKKDIHHKIVAAFVIKLPRERRGSIKSEGYPYGKRPGRPPESEAYRTRFGRPHLPNVESRRCTNNGTVAQVSEENIPLLIKWNTKGKEITCLSDDRERGSIEAVIVAPDLGPSTCREQSQNRALSR
jgi:hypothetical protein